MPAGKQELSEKALQKLKNENQSLKEKIAVLRGENKDLRKSLRKTRNLFDSIPAGIVLVQQGKILEINETGLVQLGCKAEEVIGRDFLDFIHPDLRAFESDLYKKRMSRTPVPDRYEPNLVAKNGETLCCEVTVERIRYNGRIGFLTKLTRVEERKEKVKELVRSKKIEGFVTMASGLNRQCNHCLHTLTQTARRLKDVAGHDDRNLLEGIENIKSATHTPLWITQKLESLSRAERDPSHTALFNLKKTVSEAVDRIGPMVNERAEKQGVSINLKTYLRSKSSVKGNPGEIQELILIMISNAIEAMPGGGDIYLTTEDNEGFAHIYVQDNGSGIREHIKDRIFDPFFTTGDGGRMGLGLSLAHVIVRRHRGDIEITSQKGQGTIILIKLPRARKARRLSAGSIRNKVKDAQFLIIGDEDLAGEILSQILAGKGLRVETAVSGLEGLKILKKKSIDFVISGFKTSDISGQELARKIKKVNGKLPIALIADHHQDSLADDSIVDLIIRKPIDMSKVVEQILEVMVLKKERR